MKRYLLSIPESLKTHAGAFYKARVGNRVLWFELRWDALDGNLELSILGESGAPVAQGVSLYPYRNLLADADELPGWVLVLSHPKGELIYTREEIDKLQLVLEIPETQAEIEAQPLLAVTS